MNFLNASSMNSFVKSKFSKYARITATPSASLDPSKCPIADGSTPGADRKNLAASDADTTELFGACSRKTAIVGVLLNFSTAISTDFFSFLRFANVFVCESFATDDDDDVAGASFSNGTGKANPPPNSVVWAVFFDVVLLDFGCFLMSLVWKHPKLRDFETVSIQTRLKRFPTDAKWRMLFFRLLRWNAPLREISLPPNSLFLARHMRKERTIATKHCVVASLNATESISIEEPPLIFVRIRSFRVQL